MKIGNLSSTASLFFMAAMYFCLSVLTAKTFDTAKPLSFEEFLQGVDFEKLTKDIEKAIEESEQKKDAPLSQIPAGPTGPQPMLSLPGQPGIEQLSPTQPHASVKTVDDVETIFLEPIKPVIEKGRPTHIKVSDEKKKAYDHFMGRMVEQLSELERIIENSPLISTVFKPFFTEFQGAIDEITIQNDSIRSKKNIYLAKLYEDKEGPNELRKKIVLASKQLNGFCQKLKISEEVELKTEEADEQELTAFANKKFEAPTPQQVIERKQRGRRGAPEPVASTEKIIDEKDEKIIDEKKEATPEKLPVSMSSDKEAS